MIALLLVSAHLITLLGYLMAAAVPIGAVGLAVPASLGLVAAVVLIGLLLCRLAPWFLGPTWRDRLDLAEQRLAREVKHQRLAGICTTASGTRSARSRCTPRRPGGRWPATAVTPLPRCN